MMALRGKKPEHITKRFKCLLSGPAGVGKTTASIRLPKPYIIDTEFGASHYGDSIEKSGGVVFQTQEIDEVLQEVRALYSEKHEYQTLVIDPATTIYMAEVDACERKVGSDFGRHYSEANKKFKRLCNLLTAIDMNVIITAHEKNEYGEDMKLIGKTFDGYKKLDYVFDLWLQLSRDKQSGVRNAFVAKTRIKAFKDGEVFPWSYESIGQRYGFDNIEAPVESKTLATEEDAKRFESLMARLSDDDVADLKLSAALKRYGSPEDWPADSMAKALEAMTNKLMG